MALKDIFIDYSKAYTSGRDPFYEVQMHMCSYALDTSIRLIGILNLTCPKHVFSSPHHPFLGKWHIFSLVA